jgi:uncharacterized protein
MIIPLLTTLLLAVPAGALASLVGSPLPWVIGPLVACAAANLLGAGLGCPRAARHAGQWAIGTVLGLYFTPAVLSQVFVYAPWLAIGIVYAVLLGLALAWTLRRYAGASRETAFFAGAIGGASEMAVQGERHGGRVDQIAAAHGLRIMLVVLTLPFVYQFLGLHGTDPHETGPETVRLGGLAALVVVTVASAWVLARFDWPNAWVLGPLAATIALTASGLHWSALPQPMIVAGQVLIGASLGTRFTPEFFRQGPRFLAVVAVSTLLGIVASAAFGSALGWLAGIPLATMVLATSPGGIAEMTLTAKNLRLGVPVVTVFHVTRMVVMVLAIGQIYRFTGRMRGWQS